MKTSFCAASLCAALLVGCATPEKYGAFTPVGDLGSADTTAYDDYDKGMAHVEGYDMAYEWQRKNPDLVAQATTVEALAPFVASPEAADALLAKIGTSYTGDPVALTQIAAVTQLVMCPKCPKAAQGRLVWTAALKRARAATRDGYVRVFCDQQLRLCD